MITTFFSTKGGTGQTLIATNYALLTAKHSKTVLIQFTHYPDVHTFFKITPRTHIVHMIEFLDAGENIRDALQEIAYQKDELSIFLSPQNTELYKKITHEKLQGLLIQLESHFENIIIDLGQDFTHSNAVLAASTHIITTSYIDPQSVHKTNLLIQKLQKEIPHANTHIIANQVPPTLGQRKIQEYFIGTVLGTLPYDTESAWDNVALGIPYINTQSELTKNTHTLLRSFKKISQ